MPQVRTLTPDRDAIQRLRLEAGLTAEQLARKLPGKRHGQTIRKIESTGRWAIPKVSELLMHQIALALGVKAADITKADCRSTRDVA